MSIWSELANWDLVEKLRPLLDRKALFYNSATGKINGNLSLVYDNPWVIVRPPDIIDCGIWHQICFRHLNFVHSGCLNCYKVVFRPRTVAELFKCYDVIVELNLPSKCGIDNRPYVKGDYGGYFYVNGLEEGRRVKQIAIDNLPEGIPITLKRGCTEFELAKGSLDDIGAQTEDDKRWEQIVADNIEMPRWATVQPDTIKNHIKRMWIAHAHHHGDLTTEELNDGEPLVKPLKTY